MGISEKLWRGTGRSTARYRDEMGDIVSLQRLLRNGTRAFATGIARKTIGWRPSRPWISYAASNALDRHLSSGRSRVLEFGSGMSTLWYAERAREVVSMENHREWFESVKHQIAKAPNAELRFAASREEYLAIPIDEGFDLIMIDGYWRDRCAELAVDRLNEGGVIYLDNCDKRDLGVGDMRYARQFLIDFAEGRGMPWYEFTDFAPTQFFVERGLWVGPLP